MVGDRLFLEGLHRCRVWGEFEDKTRITFYSLINSPCMPTLGSRRSRQAVGAKAAVVPVIQNVFRKSKLEESSSALANVRAGVFRGSSVHHGTRGNTSSLCQRRGGSAGTGSTEPRLPECDPVNADNIGTPAR